MTFRHRGSPQLLMIIVKPEQRADDTLNAMKTSSLLKPRESLGKLVKRVLPANPSLQVEQLEVTSEGLLIRASSTQPANVCPVCGSATTRVHSRYERTLQDLPWGNLRVRLRVCVRRFFCLNTACGRRIFSERIASLAEPSAPRTRRLCEALLQLAWAEGGEAGARQSKAHGMPVCATTLLSLLRQAREAALPTPHVLGVDDWGFGAAHPTGTLLVDLERHRPVDVLLGSDDQVLAEWLTSHPGVEIICRDRGASYARGARKGAPHAQQVLDRWHLVKNVGEVLKLTVAQHVDVLGQADQEVKTTFPRLDVPLPSQGKSGDKPRKPATPSPQRAWQLSMFEQVHALAAASAFLLTRSGKYCTFRSTPAENTCRWSTLLITGIVLSAPRWNRIESPLRHDGRKDLS
jgi:transposase